MAMPKTAVYKNCDAVFGENDIGPARERVDVEAKTHATCKEEFSKDEFWICVLAPDRTHVFTAALRAVNVRHCYAASLLRSRGC